MWWHWMPQVLCYNMKCRHWVFSHACLHHQLASYGPFNLFMFPNFVELVIWVTQSLLQCYVDIECVVPFLHSVSSNYSPSTTTESARSKLLTWLYSYLWIVVMLLQEKKQCKDLSVWTQAHTQMSCIYDLHLPHCWCWQQYTYVDGCVMYVGSAAHPHTACIQRCIIHECNM